MFDFRNPLRAKGRPSAAPRACLARAGAWACLAALALALLLAAPQARAQRYRLNAEGALRVGLYHPHPRFCSGAELTQRDLRVVRMGFGVSRDPAARAAPPWYFERLAPPGAEARAETKPAAGAKKTAAKDGGKGATPPAAPPPPDDGGESGNGAELTLRLRTKALWDRPPDWLAPADGSGRPTDLLAGWKRALARVLAPEWSAGEGAFHEIRLEPRPARPFLWSRMHGSALLPRVQAWESSSLGLDCPAWPAGVWLEPQEGELRYTLTVGRPDRGASFSLAAYRRDAALWSDFRRGRLDAVLVEGSDVPRAGSLGDGVWGVEPGTQQIVLLPAPALLAELDPAHWMALSQALAREELGPLSGEGGIAPARGFLGPLLRKRPPQPPLPLRSNPREARRIWLANPPARTRLSVATIAHPDFEAIARRIGEQWQRTLNLKTGVTPLPVDGFAASQQVWRYDLYLTAADLDDGSLQDLWERVIAPEALGAEALALGEKRIEAWEEALLKGLPYLPIAENLHWIVARDPAAIRALCPACIAPAPAPGRGAQPGGPGSEDYIPPEG